MHQNRAVRIWSASRDLPCPNDWLLSSFSPIQIEESLMRACFAPNAPCVAGGEVLQVAPPNTETYSEYVRNFDQYFESNVKLWCNLVVVASPATHHPLYAPYRNMGLSLHLFPGIQYQPYTFRRQLQSALYRFLNSSDAQVSPPDMNVPEDMYGMRNAHIPVRMFVIKIEDLCCPKTERICINTLLAVRNLYMRLPKFANLPYTASMYLATKSDPRTLDLACIGYQKRITVMPRPNACQ